MTPYPPRAGSRRMPDRLRDRLAVILAIVSLAGTAFVLIAAVSGKLGVMVVGPPDLIAQVKTTDSLRGVAVDSVLTARIVEAARTHARLDSANAAQDGRIRAFEAKLDMLVAVGCANFPRRDLGLSRLETACSSNLDRWREPGSRR